MDKKLVDKMMAIAEKFFGTETDPEQIPITLESAEKLAKLNPSCIVYETEGEEPISWVVVVPTSISLMEKFLNNEISEKELLDKSEPAKEYEAIYLCSAITVPNHQREGLALKLTKKAINLIPKKEDFKLFAWPFSKEGELMVQKLSRELSREILIRK